VCVTVDVFTATLLAGIPGTMVLHIQELAPTQPGRVEVNVLVVVVLVESLSVLPVVVLVAVPITFVVV
jgi:hypothetical protein